MCLPFKACQKESVNDPFKLSLDCFTSHVGEHRMSSVSEKGREFHFFFQNTHSATVLWRGNTICLRHVCDARHVGDGAVFPSWFGYVTIGLARHNRTHVNQSERLLVKPMSPCTDLCAEPVGVWNRLRWAITLLLTPYWCHESLGYLKKIWMPVVNIRWCPWTLKGLNIWLLMLIIKC